MGHRNYVPRQAFETYLRQRDRPFVAWAGDRTAGDVLTVDDATQAAADACITARELGHEVTLFVNPFQIVSGHPYFFSLLDAAIDDRTATTVPYAGQTFALATAAGVQRFRNTVKTHVATLAPDDAVAAVTEVAQRLGVVDVRVPAHQAPLSLADLVALRDAGVAIENHGWSHVEIGALDDAAFVRHVSQGREWLRRTLSVEASLYAVPFGATRVPGHPEDHVGEAYVLCDARWPPRQIAGRCWNRQDLTPRLQAMSRLSSYVALRGTVLGASRPGTPRG